MLSTSKEIWKFVFQYVYRLFHVLQYPDNGIPFNDIRFGPLQRPLVIYFSVIKIAEKDREKCARKRKKISYRSNTHEHRGSWPQNMGMALFSTIFLRLSWYLKSGINSTHALLNLLLLHDRQGNILFLVEIIRIKILLPQKILHSYRIPY